MPLLVGGYLAFGLLRARIDRGDPTATDNAVGVLRLEQALHIAVEYSLNQAMAVQPWTVYLTGYFYRLCLIAVPAVLVWLYLSRAADYRYLRSVLVVTTLLDLPLVWLFPEAPPRFSQSGIVDYIATHNIVGGATLRDPNAGLNLLAAMPSMHVAWTTWCAYAGWFALRRRHRWAGRLLWLFPLLTAFVVIATGHHFVLDVLAGVVLFAVSVGLTGRWYQARETGQNGWIRRLIPVP